MTKQITHCCRIMGQSIDDPRLDTGYSPRSRCYYIKLHYQHGLQGILFCPWCGTKLPESLHNQYFDTLKKEYNIDDDDDAEDAGTLPEEFKTDEWWKKRGY